MKKFKKITIKAPCRIHLTLLAMDEPVYGINGGIGFAIDGLDLRISATHNPNFQLVDYRNVTLSKEKQKSIVCSLEKAKKHFSLISCASIAIESGPPSHSGFGLGTAICLSILESYLQLNNVEYKNTDLISLSGRGGTSGIGVHTYFKGGFILDTGNTRNGAVHAPSRASAPSFPKVAAEKKMPNWNMAVFIPSGGKSIEGKTEFKFFNSVCPISHSEACEAVYHSIIGTLYSVAEKRLDLFIKSIENIQKTRWKREEINRQGKDFSVLMNKLSEISLSVGMSSLGPALLLVYDNFECTEARIKELNLSGSLYKVSPNNTGRAIEYA